MDELTSIIENSFDETIEYLKRNNIQVEEKLSLIILESYDEYQQKYGTNLEFMLESMIERKMKSIL